MGPIDPITGKHVLEDDIQAVLNGYRQILNDAFADSVIFIPPVSSFEELAAYIILIGDASQQGRIDNTDLATEEARNLILVMGKNQIHLNEAVMIEAFQQIQAPGQPLPEEVDDVTQQARDLLERFAPGEPIGEADVANVEGLLRGAGVTDASPLVQRIKNAITAVPSENALTVIARAGGAEQAINQLVAEALRQPGEASVAYERRLHGILQIIAEIQNIIQREGSPGTILEPITASDIASILTKNGYLPSSGEIQNIVAQELAQEQGLEAEQGQLERDQIQALEAKQAEQFQLEREQQLNILRSTILRQAIQREGAQDQQAAAQRQAAEQVGQQQAAIEAGTVGITEAVRAGGEFVSVTGGYVRPDVFQNFAPLPAQPIDTPMSERSNELLSFGNILLQLGQAGSNVPAGLQIVTPGYSAITQAFAQAFDAWQGQVFLSENLSPEQLSFLQNDIPAILFAEFQQAVVNNTTEFDRAAASIEAFLPGAAVTEIDIAILIQDINDRLGGIGIAPSQAQAILSDVENRLVQLGQGRTIIELEQAIVPALDPTRLSEAAQAERKRLLQLQLELEVPEEEPLFWSSLGARTGYQRGESAQAEEAQQYQLWQKQRQILAGTIRAAEKAEGRRGIIDVTAAVTNIQGRQRQRAEDFYSLPTTRDMTPSQFFEGREVGLDTEFEDFLTTQKEEEEERRRQSLIRPIATPFPSRIR